MKPMIIGMISLAVIAAILAALSVRIFTELKEWEAIGTELQEENDALREDNNKLCVEKLALISSAENAENDTVKLKLQYQDAIEALEEARAELTELKAAASRTVETISNDEQSKGDTSLLPPEGVHTNTYRCEDYRLFDPRSDQAKFQKECYTGEYSGARYYCKDKTPYVCAAMGGAYGTEIGQAYHITLRNGRDFNVILADFKHPIDDVNPYDYGDGDINYDGQECICVIEFVVDMDAVPQEVKQAGTMSAMPEMGGLYGYGGDIVKIERLGRVWEP